MDWSWVFEGKEGVAGSKRSEGGINEDVDIPKAEERSGGA